MIIILTTTPILTYDAIGAGWALAKLPVNIEESITKYDPLLCSLAIDGFGFHEAYFKTHQTVYEMREPKRLKKASSKKVFYQGVGRAHWFIDVALRCIN